LPTVQLDQVSRDCQSQVESSETPSRLAIGLPNPLEDKGQEVSRDAGAGITDQNRQPIRIDIAGDADDTLFRGELDRVRQDVAENLMKALVIAMGERGTPRHPSQQRDPFRFGSGNHAREGRIDELGDEQRPALYGGVSALELDVDGIHRVPLDIDAGELERRLVLCYTGEPRNSGTNNWDITKRHIDGDRHIFECFERIRDTAAAMRDALVKGDWDAVGRYIAEEWDNRKRLAPGVTTPAIDDLIVRARAAGATAAKVCGAGGGGCMFCYGPPDKRAAIAAALADGGARILDYRIESHGLTRG